MAYFIHDEPVDRIMQYIAADDPVGLCAHLNKLHAEEGPADFCIRTDNGRYKGLTPLILIAQTRDLEMLQVALCPEFARFVGGLEEVDGLGNTALTYSIRRRKTECVLAFMDAALFTGDTLFESHDYVIDAARAGNDFILTILVRHGGDVHRKSVDPSKPITSALAEACAYGRVKCVEYLLDQEASLQVDVGGRSMAYQAVTGETAETHPNTVVRILELLIRHGEDIALEYDDRVYCLYKRTLLEVAQQTQLDMMSIQPLGVNKRVLLPRDNDTVAFLKLILLECSTLHNLAYDINEKDIDRLRRENTLAFIEDHPDEEDRKSRQVMFDEDEKRWIKESRSSVRKNRSCEALDRLQSKNAYVRNIAYTTAVRRMSTFWSILPGR